MFSFLTKIHSKALQLLIEVEGLLNMPLEPPEWLSKAIKLLPSRVPFGF
nr:MAG TPA: hypothetical protein [Caudoviricetes sp.]